MNDFLISGYVLNSTLDNSLRWLSYRFTERYMAEIGAQTALLSGFITSGSIITSIQKHGRD